MHTLGNLTLSAENTVLSNHPMERKREIYERCALRMNREIAEALRWGKAEILTRADRLVDRILALWPGPLAGVPEERKSDWSLLNRALAEILAGTWTTYGDVAELIGTHPVPVGVHIAQDANVVNAWRVLTSDGRVAAGFRWSDRARTDSAVDVLKAEGVRFDESDKADPAQRIRAADLAELLGMDVTEFPGPNGAGGPTERRDRFLAQLRQHRRPSVATNVERVLDTWVSVGGMPSFGTKHETSCSLRLERPRTGSQPWITPVNLYPVLGTAEIGFGSLRRRPPFDDVALRETLRLRLQDIDGVTLPVGKIALYPSFPLDVLGGEVSVERLIETLRWFVETIREFDASDTALASDG